MSFQRRDHNFRGRNSRRVLPESREGYFVQVHFTGKPGTNKKKIGLHRVALTDLLDQMMRRGQLLACGRYLSSVGGMWLVKVNSPHEAERLAKEHPGVKENLLSFRINVLMEHNGLFLRAAEADRQLVEA